MEWETGAPDLVNMANQLAHILMSHLKQRPPKILFSTPGNEGH